MTLSYLLVNVKKQTLSYIKGGQVCHIYPISTAVAGCGEQRGSEKTPRGWHTIRAKIGGNAPAGAVFVGRRPTGEVYSPELAVRYPNRDWILSRILWLAGLESGLNRGGEFDTQRRYIYIHGCPDSISFVAPSSHGCIRMYNQDVIYLFDAVKPGMKLLIVPA